MGWKKHAVKMIERVVDARILRPDLLGIAFGQDHLCRFLNYFQVDCVFDVGANAGQYAQMLRREVDYQGVIISYEPIPEHAAALREQAKHDAKWIIEELALDATPGTAVFNILAGNQFSSLHEASATATALFKNQTRLGRRIEVNTSTVADQMAKHRGRLGFKRPFLKMDTQGHDNAVVRGAGVTLSEFVGLQSELAIKQLYLGAPGLEESLELYRRCGFELSAFVPNNLGHFPRLLEVDCIMYRPQAIPTGERSN